MARSVAIAMLLDYQRQTERGFELLMHTVSCLAETDLFIHFSNGEGV